MEKSLHNHRHNFMVCKMKTKLKEQRQKSRKKSQIFRVKLSRRFLDINFNVNEFARTICSKTDIYSNTQITPTKGFHIEV